MTPDDPSKPDEGTPPRPVYDWTRVKGHIITGRDTRAPLCSCGERRLGGDVVSSREWVDRHLREAWPILHERDRGESWEDFYRRLTIAHDEALLEQERADEAAGVSQPVQPGQPFPTITSEMMTAGERVEVLEHQLAEAKKRAFPEFS